MSTIAGKNFGQSRKRELSPEPVGEYIPRTISELESILNGLQTRSRSIRGLDLGLLGSKVTDAHLQRIINLPGLVNLNLSRCDNLSAKAMEEIAALTQLTHLNLAATKANSETIKSLSNLNLQHLFISDLVGATSASDALVLSAILNFRSNTIQELDIAGNKALTGSGVDRILGKFNNLKLLDICECDKVSNSKVNRMINNGNKLIVVHTAELEVGHVEREGRRRVNIPNKQI